MKTRMANLALVALLALSAFPIADGLKVTGGLISETVAPGQELDHEIYVYLDKDEYVSPLLTVNLSGFAMDENGTNIMLPPERDNKQFSAKDFLTVTPMEIQIQPDVPQKILVKAQIPDDVGTGSRYALISLKTSTPVKEMENIVITKVIQVPVFFKIKGSEFVETGEIKDLDTLKSNEGIVINLRFMNTGNVHYKPTAKAVLKNQEGEILAASEPLESSSSVLPTGVWLFSMPIVSESELSPGDYVIEAAVTDEEGKLIDSGEVALNI